MVAHACHPSTWKEGWGGEIADSQLYIVSSIWGQQYMVHSMLVWAKEWDPFSRLKFFQNKAVEIMSPWSLTNICFYMIWESTSPK